MYSSKARKYHRKVLAEQAQGLNSNRCRKRIPVIPGLGGQRQTLGLRVSHLAELWVQWELLSQSSIRWRVTEKDTQHPPLPTDAHTHARTAPPPIRYIIQNLEHTNRNKAPIKEELRMFVLPKTSSINPYLSKELNEISQNVSDCSALVSHSENLVSISLFLSFSLLKLSWKAAP